jgi:hypothetical protein
MRVLDIGLSPTVLVTDEAAAEEWMSMREMTDEDKTFLRWNFRWIDVLTIDDVRKGSAGCATK